MEVSQTPEEKDNYSLALHLFPRHPRLAPISPVRLTCFNEQGKEIKPKTPVRDGFFRRFGKWATSMLGTQETNNNCEEDGMQNDQQKDSSSGSQNTTFIPCKNFYQNSSPTVPKRSCAEYPHKVRTKTLVKSIAPRRSLKLVKLPEKEMREHIKKNSPTKLKDCDDHNRGAKLKAWCRSTMRNSLCGISCKSKMQKKNASKFVKKSPVKLEELERSLLSWGKFDGSFVIGPQVFYGGLGRKDKENEAGSSVLPVRKSKRKTARRVQFEQKLDIFNKIKNKCQEGIKMVELPGKGRGVVTTRPFRKGEFVVEYVGELVEHEVALAREQAYEGDDSIGCYMYFFRHGDEVLCVDATEESPHLGRLINHSRLLGNLTPRVVVVGGVPHIVLEARHDLTKGVELLFDYGDRSREALEHHPWLNE